MNRYVDIRCPKCGGKHDIVLVYSLGWAVRDVSSFDRFNGEVEFKTDRYETVDMTEENTPFGAPPPSHFIHFADPEQSDVCHRWTEEEEIEAQKSYELAIYWAIRRVVGMDKAGALIDRNRPRFDAWEQSGLSAERAALRIVALEMDLPEEA